MCVCVIGVTESHVCVCVCVICVTESHVCVCDLCHGVPCVCV